MEEPPPAIAAVTEALHGLDVPWCIAGGWAIDLFLGRRTREHGDLDLAIFRDGQARLRGHLAGWSFRVARHGVLVEWGEGEWLAAPYHEIHARSPAGLAAEFLLNERAGDEWVFRRDPAVRCPAAEWIERSPGGLPVLSPAIVLLYKAKAPRASDLLDFHAVRAQLSPERRAWLRAALQRVHPGHPWLRAL